MLSFSETQKPFVGISTFTTHQQVEIAKSYFGQLSDRRLHIGAMTSQEAFHANPEDVRSGKTLLTKEELCGVFTPGENVFNVLHWKDDGMYPMTTSKDLIMACTECSLALSGLQLDMVWPDPEMVMEVKKNIPKLSVIVRVCDSAMRRSEVLGPSFKYMLTSYVGIADYILLDCGMNEDTTYVSSKMLALIQQATLIFPETSIIVGGGMCSTTVNTLHPILTKYPRISWEACEGLHTRRSLVDPLDINRMKEYLAKSKRLALRFKSI